jgi:hypothetical protein
MKTTELTGILLDYWVAKADGLEPWAGATMPKGEFMWKAPRAIAPTHSSDRRLAKSQIFAGLGDRRPDH